MKRFFLKILWVVVPMVIGTILFSSCNHEGSKTTGVTTETTGFSLDSAKAAIAASNKVYGACFASGDSTAFANCYTSDACIMPTGMPKMCGTQAILGFFNGGRKMGITNISLTTDEVMGGKDAVVETGKYELIVGDKVSAEKGKYIIVWKEENGKWKMHRDIWNSDAPAPTAPAK